MSWIIIFNHLQMFKIFDEVRFFEVCEKLGSRGVVDPHYLVDQFTFFHYTAHT